MFLLHGVVMRWTDKGYVGLEAQYWEPYLGVVAKAKGQQAPAQQIQPTGPWSGQIPFINNLMSEALRLYKEGQPEYYPGQTTPNINPSLTGSQAGTTNFVNDATGVNQAAINSAAAVAGGAFNNPVAQFASGLASPLQGAIQGLLQPQGGPAGGVGAATAPGAQGAINAATGAQAGPINAPSVEAAGIGIQPELQRSLQGGALNPFLEQLVSASTRGMERQYNDEILPGIASEGNLAGQFGGGGRTGVAEGIAASRLNQDIGDVRSRIYGQAADRAADERSQVLGLITGAQGQQAGLNLTAQQAAEQARQGTVGQGLQGAQLSLGALTDAERLRLQGTLGGAELGAGALQGGQNAAIDQYIRSLSTIPGFQQQQIGNLGAVNQYGLQQYGLEQAGIDADMQKYWWEALGPYTNLAQFQDFISGSYGGSVEGKPPKVSQGSTFERFLDPGGFFLW